MNRVGKAVIPVAGYGTRLYPASKAIKKELFPIIDTDGMAKPLIQVIIVDPLVYLKNVEMIISILARSVMMVIWKMVIVVQRHASWSVVMELLMPLRKLVMTAILLLVMGVRVYVR